MTSPPPFPSADPLLDVVLPRLRDGSEQVLDVGSGSGDLVSALRARGVRAVGAECGEEMLRRHATVAPVGGGGAVGAAGEALPFRAALFDLVVFGYSLHHVPVDRRRTALAEARRVLRPCGNVLVVEPVADDPDTLVAHPAVDERVELEQVQEMLGRSFRSGLVVESSTEFESVAVYADFESWCRLIVGIDPHRAALVDRHRERLRSQFHELGRRTSQGWGFERRSRLAVLRPV